MTADKVSQLAPNLEADSVFRVCAELFQLSLPAPLCAVQPQSGNCLKQVATQEMVYATPNRTGGNRNG
jgi:hypothetical protein